MDTPHNNKQRKSSFPYKLAQTLVGLIAVSITLFVKIEKKTFIASIKKLDIAGSGLERDIHSTAPPVSTLIGHLATGKRQTLLLLDHLPLRKLHPML